MSEATIRRARPADAEAIASVHVAGWRWAYRGQVPDELLDGLSAEGRVDGRRRGLLSQEAGEAFPRIWVAESDGRVVGFVATIPCRDPDAPVASAEVGAIYLEEAAAGRGIGRALFGRALEDLRREGFVHSLLWVLESNERARRFYEAAGLHTDGAVRDEDMGGFTLHEVRYRRKLNP